MRSSHGNKMKTNETTEANRIFKRVAWRLVPLLFLIYVAAYLDRVNVGYAKLQFSADLGISDFAYGLGAGLFLHRVHPLEVPSNLYLAKKGARAVLSRIMILWGLASAGMMFVQSETSFYVLRFLLGAAEAGLIPGVMLYLTYWFPPAWRARIVSLFMLAIPVSGLIGAPLSGWIMETFDGVKTLRGWQWMFLLEAIPSLLLGIYVICRFDNTPNDAKWLSQQEKALIANQLRSLDQPQVKPLGIVKLLGLARFWLLGVIYFCLVMGNVGFSFWLPQLVSDIGAKGLMNIGLLSAVPYAVAGIGMVAIAFSSDRLKERRWHYAICSGLGALGLVVCCLYSKTMPVALGGISLSYLGILACFGIFWSIASEWMKPSEIIVGFPLINMFSAVSGYLSPFMLGAVRNSTGSLEIGLYIIAICLFLSSLLALRIPKAITRPQF